MRRCCCSFFYPFNWRLNWHIIQSFFAAVDPSIKWSKKYLFHDFFFLSNYIFIAFRILGFLIYYKALPPAWIGRVEGNDGTMDFGFTIIHSIDTRGWNRYRKRKKAPDRERKTYFFFIYYSTNVLFSHKILLFYYIRIIWLTLIIAPFITKLLFKKRGFSRFRIDFSVCALSLKKVLRLNSFITNNSFIVKLVVPSVLCYIVRVFIKVPQLHC